MQAERRIPPIQLSTLSSPAFALGTRAACRFSVGVRDKAILGGSSFDEVLLGFPCTFPCISPFAHYHANGGMGMAWSSDCSKLLIVFAFTPGP